MVTVHSREDDGMYETEMDFFTLRDDSDIYGRNITKRGSFYDPESGREIRWKRHVFI